MKKLVSNPRFLSRCIAVAGLALTAQTALAQLEEIIVTAQKRSQSVLEVPATMDVIQGEFLDRTSTMELDDLSRILPNVVIQEQAVSLPSFNIRGITDDTASISSTPRISVYQDGFDISKKTVSSAALYDVERVEVLKGPQPTLFGVAAANGALSIISNKPVDEFQAGGNVAVNSESGTEAQFMVNAPISDHVAFRVAGLYREQDGIIDNKACSENSYNPSGVIENQDGVLVSCDGGDLNGVSVAAFRASLRATYDKFEVIARISQENNDQPGISFKSGSIAPADGDTSPFSAAELGYGSELGIERDLTAYDITASYEFSDNLILEVDSYYKDVELTEAFDADGSGLRIQDAWFKNDATLNGSSARLVFNAGERFRGFVGASTSSDDSILPYTILVDPYVRGVFDAKKAELEALYPNIPLNQNVSTNASLADIEAVRAELVAVLFNADGTAISGPNGPSTEIRGPYVFEAEIDILSYVAEGTFDVTDQLSLTAGLRYIDEDRYARDYGFYEAKENFTATLPRLAVNYAYSDDLSLYFNYAQGRRSPVVNPNFGSPSVTKEETVDSFDVGFKYVGDRMSLFGAAFVYDYKDYQQSFTDAETLQSNTVTVGDSTMWGLEGTINYAFSDSLVLGASVGVLDAKFADETAARVEWLAVYQQTVGGGKLGAGPEPANVVSV